MVFHAMAHEPKKYKERKNEIEIWHPVKGYYMRLIDNNAPSGYTNSEPQRASYNLLIAGDFYDVISTLAGVPEEDYNKGIKLTFGKKDVRLQKKEKETIERVVRRLEASGLNHKKFFTGINSVLEAMSLEISNRNIFIKKCKSGIGQIL